MAKKHAKKATECFREAPAHAGKKRFMARQLPFDVYVTRKVAKWEARAKEWNVDFIDAIGINPIEETIYFWNGHTRMTNEQLEHSLKNLAWSESKDNKTWHREDTEEKAILALLRAAVYRTLHRHEEAKEVLYSQILVHDRNIFKGHLKDDWTCPTAHFEMAANLWMERYCYRESDGPSLDGNSTKSTKSPRHSEDEQPKSPASKASSLTAKEVAGGEGDWENHDEHDRHKAIECKDWLDKASKWESYDLDARVGLKITIAEETVRNYLAPTE